MSLKHPVDPPPEWAPTWDDSFGGGPFRLGLLDELEGGGDLSAPGRKKPDRDDHAATGSEAVPPARPARPLPRAPRTAAAAAPAVPVAPAAPVEEPGAKPRDWIYDQLGLTKDTYEAAPSAGGAAPSRPGQPSGVPSLDFDALRNEDPFGSPFPPGSLGGGLADPEPRVFHGFPKPGTGGGLAAAEPPPAPAPAPESPSTPSRPEPAEGWRRAVPPTGENPFRIYDEATGSIALPKVQPAVPGPAGQHASPGSAAAEQLRSRSSSTEPTFRAIPTPADLRAALADRLTAESLTAESVLRTRRRVAGRGWRKGLLAATGGVVNLGPSGRERRDAELETRVRAPISGCHRLAVISLKGGVGKTTTVATLGSMFASIRSDRVIAVDANPDRGTLGEKIATDRPTANVRDFVRRSAQFDRYSAVREFTGQADSRLEVLRSESDPLASTAFSELDYRVIADVLERYYNLVITDCGTGLLHSAMVGVLAKADQVMIISSASLDGARSASATLDWLEAHGYGPLARESVTVVTSVRPKAGTVDLDEIVGHFARRTRSVVAVPYDEHLAEGGQVDLGMLGRGSYQAHLQLAAEVADAFSRF